MSFRPSTLSSARASSPKEEIMVRTRARLYSSDCALWSAVIASSESTSAETVVSLRLASAPRSAAAIPSVRSSSEKPSGSAGSRFASTPSESIARASWARSPEKVTSSRNPLSTE
jgi:hypothetical protein